MPKLSIYALLAMGAAFAGLGLLPGCINKQMVGNENTVMGTVQVCSSCHGLEGRNSNPTFPILAGQQHDYIVNQLKSFRDHTRADPHAHTYMWGMAAKLTDATIDGVATYYAKQETAPPTAQDPALVGPGKLIFAQGLASANIPACSACHGDTAGGNDTIPRLASQHRAYLEAQLRAFQVKSRANEMMDENAKNLSPQQIDELSAYLASLK